MYFLCIGGIAGAASRITGAMAKGVAAITMDEDFMLKRRETMNRQPTGLKDGLARGGKGLVSVCKHFFPVFLQFYFELINNNVSKCINAVIWPEIIFG